MALRDAAQERDAATATAAQASQEAEKLRADAAELGARARAAESSTTIEGGTSLADASVARGDVERLRDALAKAEDQLAKLDPAQVSTLEAERDDAQRMCASYERSLQKAKTDIAKCKADAAAASRRADDAQAGGGPERSLSSTTDDARAAAALRADADAALAAAERARSRLEAQAL